MAQCLAQRLMQANNNMSNKSLSLVAVLVALSLWTLPKQRPASLGLDLYRQGRHNP